MAGVVVKYGVFAFVLVLSVWSGCEHKEERGGTKKRQEEKTAPVLSPPMQIPLMPDKLIRHLNAKTQLNYFSFEEGLWSSRRMEGEYVMVGEASCRGTCLVSLESLSRKPKSFKFDFKITHSEGGLGLIYGGRMLYVRGDELSLREIDLEGTQISSSEVIDTGRLHENVYGVWNTFGISTGYDPLGRNGDELETSLRLNGRGFQFENNEGNGKFGIYLKGKCRVYIRKFRWFRGGK